VIVYGDGSFGLNGFEYDTAVRHGLPIIGVVGNDAAWGQMMRPQGAMYGWDRLTATLLEPTRYDKVVEALGGHGEFVERPEDLRPALERAADSGKPALVNVVIRQDREFNGWDLRLIAGPIEAEPLARDARSESMPEGVIPPIPGWLP
jgi:acetolactate synthase-1/2/3 large subunit